MCDAQIQNLPLAGRTVSALDGHFHHRSAGHRHLVRHDECGRSVHRFDNLTQIGRYSSVFARSLILAAISTVICLVMAFPVGYFLSRMRANKQHIMLMLIMLPMWMNFLLRTYAWMTLLEKNGLINKFFGLFGLGPFNMINTSGAVVLGMVYNYLPFMILPIYTAMTKIDDSIVEAAQDLGCNVWQILFRVLVPLTGPGIATGITQVFVPAVSTFIISRMLGGGSNLLIGDLIELQFLGNSYNLNLWLCHEPGADGHCPALHELHFELR